jgi:hypothetical protein
LSQSIKKHGRHREFLFLIGRFLKIFSETAWPNEPKLWKVLYKFYVFYADGKSKMATTAGHRLTLDPMGKCSNAFFSETTNIIKAKLLGSLVSTVQVVSEKKHFETFFP